METQAPRPISARLAEPAYRSLGARQSLAPLFATGAPHDLEAWSGLRRSLRAQWLELLGTPGFDRVDRRAQVAGRWETADLRGTLYLQPTGPRTSQRVLVLEPLPAPAAPRPAAVVPYYHPEDMAGCDAASGEPRAGSPALRLGRHLARQGYVVACPEAFPYNTVPEPRDAAWFAWWQAAAEEVLRENPRWTGMGKLVHDTSLVLDLLLEQPDIDPGRIAAVGHSLGGKMAFVTSCLDERVAAVVASDFGIGWSFTNWDAPWYFGAQIRAPKFALALHQLLALLAPRSFLLIAGEYDKPESWQYLLAAKEVYRLHGREAAVGMLDHATGHEPPETALELAYRWLAEQLDLPFGSWGR